MQPDQSFEVIATFDKSPHHSPQTRPPFLSSPHQARPVSSISFCAAYSRTSWVIFIEEKCGPHIEAYAARDSLWAIALAMSFFFAPAASSARIRRSIETAGSLASIFATLDWLERRRLANSVCESP